MEITSGEIRTKFCKHCAEKIGYEAVICTKCGNQVEELKKNDSQNIIINNSNSSINTNTNNNLSDAYLRTRSRNKWVALTLLILFGVFGAHKFYEGKTGRGILYLFTFGLFGIGVVVDFFGLIFKPNPYFI